MPPSSVKITFQEPVSIPFGFLTWWHLCCKTTLSKPLKQSPSPKARSTHSMDHSLLVSQSPVHHLPWLHLLTHSSPQSSPCTGATAWSTVCWKVEMTQMDDLWAFHEFRILAAHPYTTRSVWASWSRGSISTDSSAGPSSGSWGCRRSALCNHTTWRFCYTQFHS